MQIEIQRVDPSLPLPKYESKGAVGFDLITRKMTLIEPGAIGLVPGNVIVKVPRGYALLVLPAPPSPEKSARLPPLARRDR